VTSAALRFISRLMPPMAGERWLAEANSLLFEAGETRRAMLSRHYLLSAPRVVATMWLLEASRGVRLSRRTRKGPRTRDGRRTGEGRRHGPPEQR
ncbi:MAG: hypothetical protein HOV97_19940, partial [Nonomuraea sp.]|nr:hypothetical protein [Nonomuraea sp.]